MERIFIMKFIKNENKIALEASSVKQLNANLTEAIERKGAKPCAVAVAISDPNVIVCQFEMESTAVKDLEHHLISEVCEIMSLTPDEIALDFQITKSDQKSVQGIYICVPRNIFEEYLSVLDKKSFNVLKVTEQFLVSIDFIFQRGKLNNERICFLDFSIENTIGLFISNKKECELLRKIHFENYEEAYKEVVQSLRSASAKSRVKHYDYIYYHGRFERIDDLTASLQQRFHTEVEELPSIDQKAALTDGRAYFRLNLIRKYNFSQNQVKYIYAGVNIFIALCAMNCALMSLAMIKKNMEISRVKDYYQDKDYQYAVKLSGSLKK